MKIKKTFDSATNCSICRLDFEFQGKSRKSENRVRDHCHLTGKFRGAAHNNCNLNYKLGNFIPVFFHNLSNYDSHLFIKKIGRAKGNVNCIPCNQEKYVSFTKQVVVANTT